MVLLIGESTVHAVWNYSVCWQLPFCAFCLVAQTSPTTVWEGSCIRDVTGTPGWHKALPVTSGGLWPLLQASDQRLPPTQAWHRSSSFCWPQSWWKPAQLELLPPLDIATCLLWIFLWGQISWQKLPFTENEKKKQPTILHEMNRQWYCRAVPAWVPQAKNLT